MAGAAVRERQDGSRTAVIWPYILYCTGLYCIRTESCFCTVYENTVVVSMVSFYGVFTTVILWPHWPEIEIFLSRK
jgi:hypothetical protein